MAKKRKTGPAKKGKKSAGKKSTTSPNVGFLLATTLEDWQPYIDTFKRALPKGVNVTILPPNGANGDQNTIDVTADYLAQYFDVIVTATTYAAQSCLRATRKFPDPTTKRPTPFVFASLGDPIGSGLVPNSTDHFCGGDNQQVKLVKKRVVDHMLTTAKFKEPFAVVGNPVGPAKTAMEVALGILAANGQQAQLAPITTGTKPKSLINALKGVKSLYVCSDLYVTSIASELATAAKAAKMKTMWEFAEHKSIHGGDEAFGVDINKLFEEAAWSVGKILNGTTPGQLGIWTAPDGPAP